MSSGQVKCGPAFYLDLPELALCKQPGILLMDPWDREKRTEVDLLNPVGPLKWYQEEAEMQSVFTYQA